jgi:tetratricopeptide (TPR) repeat protein
MIFASFLRLHHPAFPLLVLCIAGFVTTTSGQANKLFTPSLIAVPNAQPTSAAHNVSDADKLARVKKIYYRLVSARGDYRYPVPQVFLRDEESRVASIDYQALEIVLESKAYEVCDSFGDAAIAFLLGHELTHYYEKHAWRSEYSYQNKDLHVAKKMMHEDDLVANEVQSDYLGGLLAYSAGFGLFERSDSMIARLYAAYHLKPEIPGYPSFKERLTLAQRSTEKLQSLARIYDMANYLVATGMHEEAEVYYRYLLMFNPSSQLYNNAGYNALSLAMTFMDSSEVKYQYSMELDLRSQGGRDVGLGNPKRFILLRAIEFFNSAIALDPEYAPAYLNKATACALLKDTLGARYFCEHDAIPLALKNNLKKTWVDARILSAILNDQSGDVQGAKTILQELVAESALAQVNLDIVNGGKLSMPTPGTFRSFVDTVSSINLVSFSKRPQFLTAAVESIDGHQTFYPYSLDSLKMNIQFNLNEDTRMITYFMVTKPGAHVATQLGIKPGNTRKQVEKLYGKPRKILETPQGSILAYQSNLFILNEEQKVIRWINYLQIKSPF